MKKMIVIFIVALTALTLGITFVRADEPIQESIIFKSIYSNLEFGSASNTIYGMIEGYKFKYKIFEIGMTRETSKKNKWLSGTIYLIHDNGKESMNLYFKENKLTTVEYRHSNGTQNNKNHEILISKNQTKDGIIERSTSIKVSRSYKELDDLEYVLKDFFKIVTNYFSEKSLEGMKITNFYFEAKDGFMTVKGKIPSINPEGWE